MAISTINSDLFVNGSISSKGFTAPDSSITNAMVQSNAGIEATKVIHQQIIRNRHDGTVTATTKLLHLAEADGEIISVKVRAITAPTGDFNYTVDIKKAAASGAFASILSSVITIDSSVSDNTNESGTLSTTTYSADDVFQVVVAVSGGTGVQGSDYIVSLVLREPAQ
jgi:hypothetical protein